MASENETVADIKNKMYGIEADEFGYVKLAQSDFIEIADRLEAAYKREIAELKQVIAELLDALQSIYNEECTSYGTGEVYNKWRKALEGAKDVKNN